MPTAVSGTVIRLRFDASMRARPSDTVLPLPSTTTIELNAGSSGSVKSIVTAAGAAATAALAAGSLFARCACANATDETVAARMTAAALRPNGNEAKGMDFP